jgi:fructosamine-3-kinase
VPTPRCLGFAAEREEAALLMERLVAVPFTPEHRIEAARILARLHLIQVSDLSPELADLISRSTPNRGRVGEAPDQPPLREIALQHGDYYSVNLAATAEGLRVLDWDLLALGDPMWDLGFLLEADSGITESEAEEVIEAYRSIRRPAMDRLNWQRECWCAYWRLRQL